jgi:hypothetical protein
MSAPPINDTTTIFIRLGEEIQKAIGTRISRHNGEVEACLTTVSTMLKDRAQDNSEQVAEQAAALMLVLEGAEHLTSNALVVQTNLKRASFLTNETLDLACIAKNLESSSLYRVTLEEAKRYGLV